MLVGRQRWRMSRLPGHVGAVAEPVGADDEVAVVVEEVGPAVVIAEDERKRHRGGHASPAGAGCPRAG